MRAISGTVDLTFLLWCGGIAAAWLAIRRCIGYRQLNTFTLFLPLLVVTNGIFVPLSRHVNSEITGYIVSDDAFSNYWISIALMYVIMPIGISVANRFRDHASTADAIFRATPRSPANAQLYIALVVVLSLTSIAQIYLDGIQLDVVSFFTGFGSYAEYAAHRYPFAAATQGWAYYLYNRLPYGIAPLAYVMIWNWAGGRLSWKVLLISIVAFAVLQTGHKMPLVVIGCTLLVSRYAFRHEMRLTPRLLLTLAILALVVLTVALPLLYLGEGLPLTYGGALYWAVERVVAEPHRALQLYFEVYPKYHPYLYGLTSRTLAAVLGASSYVPASQYIPNGFLGVENTSFPALFIGEAWADFGYVGVVAYSFIVGFVLQAYNVWYYNRSVRHLEDSALLLCIAIGSVHLLASTVLAALVTYGLGTSLLMYAVARGVRLVPRSGPLAS